MGSIFLTAQERRILTAARAGGAVRGDRQIEFDWRDAAKTAGIRPEEAQEVVKGLRRFGFVGAMGHSHARLTESGVDAAVRFEI